eukprot:augustus_masked-scaffold_78-processed-gene-0.12-mRNA-1 protein AED:1.00 eAED:1.00 QI:0/-1/0/0/-1/1/1/0/115
MKSKENAETTEPSPQEVIKSLEKAEDVILEKILRPAKKTSTLLSKFSVSEEVDFERLVGDLVTLSNQFLDGLNEVSSTVASSIKYIGPYSSEVKIDAGAIIDLDIKEEEKRIAES